METSQHVRALINRWSKYGFTPLRFVVHSSGWGDLTPLHVKTHLGVLVCLCVRVCLDLEHHCLTLGRTFPLSSLPYLCSFFRDILYTSYLVFCWVLCHVWVLFLCYSMLLCFGGHGDLRTLNALLCAWPSFIEISHSVQKIAVLEAGKNRSLKS